MPAPIVAVLAFDGISPFHLSVPCLVFGEDRTEQGLPAFDFRVCAETPNTLLGTRSGLGLMAPYDLSAMAEADIVIVPSWRDLDQPVPAFITGPLQAAHNRGALVVGLCLGAFPIVAAGLLDGRTATTHWAFADQLRRFHPAVAVDPDVLYIDHGDVVISAGSAASLDCCLHIVRRLYGAEPASRVARRIVLPPHRQGGQAQFIERPLAPQRPDTLSLALEHVLADLASPHDIDAVASRAHLTRRTFTRRFQKAMGTSFAKWLAAQRIARAQQLLETTAASVEDVARLAGFGTSASLRQHFAAELSTSPIRYRREFAQAG